ncbi:DUF192 domain-containing protein [Geomonas edaphica]|uniref:DUF192 domain-containing protein n=1 Tax=Geomonas edaphica TaxID=2570226 RepID=UPI0010A9418B|nr:DUF192 domain-containing protein [Geomonas edaphica]
MKVMNATSGREVAGNVTVAGSFFSRLKGLIGKKSLPDGEALWIKPCNSVHTFGMRFPIDVVFLDRDLQVVAVKARLRPNAISGIHRKACSVLELPAGALCDAITAIGDRFEIG